MCPELLNFWAILTILCVMPSECGDPDIECKRLSSEKQLKKRIDEAAEQLSKAPKNIGEKVIGLIFVDVSSCIAVSVQSDVNTADDAKREVNRELKFFLSRNADKVEAANRKYVDVSHATCFSATLPIWTRCDYVMQTVSQIDVRAAATLSDERFNELEKVLSGVEQSLTEIFRLMEFVD